MPLIELKENTNETSRHCACRLGRHNRRRLRPRCRLHRSPGFVCRSGRAIGVADSRPCHFMARSGITCQLAQLWKKSHNGAPALEQRTRYIHLRGSHHSCDFLQTSCELARLSLPDADSYRYSRLRAPNAALGLHDRHRHRRYTRASCGKRAHVWKIGPSGACGDGDCATRGSRIRENHLRSRPSDALNCVKLNGSFRHSYTQRVCHSRLPTMA
jgi:hypothetical protein